MKKYTLLYLLSALIICSCGQQSRSVEENTPDSLKNGNTTKKPENIQHKIIPLGAEFNNIISISGANIIFTQGDYNMEVVGDSSLLQYMETEIDSHVLTISFASERDKNISVYDGKINVTVNVSAPDLKCISLCGNGDFTSNGLWKEEKIEFGMIGNGNFHCDSIECKDLDYQATGNGNADFKYIKADRMHFANSAGSNVEANIDAGFLQCDNAGHSTMTFTGHANNTDLNPTKNGKILLK